MQTFLFRASLTRPPCSFSSFSVSYSYRLSKITNTRAVTEAIGNPRVAADFPLKRKFGEFYKRFYSAVSRVVVPVKNRGRQHGPPTNSREKTVEPITETRTEARRRRRQRLAQLYEQEVGKANNQLTGLAEIAGEKHVGPHYQRESYIRPPLRKRKLHPSQRFTSKERRLLIENSTMGLASRFLDHDRLCRELRAEIARRQVERGRVSGHNKNLESKKEIEDLEKSLVEEVDLLKRTLRYISVHYYDPPTSPTGPQTELDPSTGLKASPTALFTPYLPPFPNYTSSENPALLNRSLAHLLLIRPPPPALVPRICYNLLTSPSPPNVSTYNILIEGLTHVRNGSLAHLVFRNMVEGGLGPNGKPDEGTVIRMVNLCVKTSDREGYERIAKITAHRNMAKWWGFRRHRRPKTREEKARNKMVLEAFINGAARFGDVQQARVWLRAITRECPESPDPSIHLYTSLMRLWTEKKDWDRGLRCWRNLMRLDLEWHCDRKGSPVDIRAFHQMLKLCQACGKGEIHRRILAMAVRRGFKAEEVLASISKTKGLWVRRENKTPHIRGQRGNSANEGLEILEWLERAWDRRDLEFSGEDEVDNSNISINRKQRSIKRPAIPDATKSQIWQDVISRRMDDIRPASVSGGDFGERRDLGEWRERKRARQDLAEQKEQWKQIQAANREMEAKNSNSKARKERTEAKGRVMATKKGRMRTKYGTMDANKKRNMGIKEGTKRVMEGALGAREGNAGVRKGKEWVREERAGVREGKLEAKEGKAAEREGMQKPRKERKRR